ncbi:hypothetical protein AB0I22_16805 [Streptomyces sp. NPDC050610]|uniref:hypothetical protein n=1 Tax=Streptomyces sp. NPDC050610 TaxID=3157097 RepID=UPI00343E9DB1
MGIESDQLVYDYLSRVGDLAQQRGLPSGDRMRLVAKVRTDIDQQRAALGMAENPSAVKRILTKMGTPEKIVEGAGPATGGTDGAAAAPVHSPVTGRPRTSAREKLSGLTGLAGRGGRGGPAAKVPAPRVEGEPERSPTAALPPHLAGEDELGPGIDAPDWWRIEPGPFTEGETVHGFVGGIEIPEILKPPPKPKPESEPESESEPKPKSAGRGPVEQAAAGDDEDEEAEEDGAVEGAAARRRLRILPRRGPREGSGVRMSPLILLAAVLLVVGAVLGNWIVLGLGWALAYTTRRLSRTESQWAVMVVPGLTAAGGIVWLWGRSAEHWGDPIPQGQMGPALSETWPVVVRVAAVASAAFLIWRARRQV